MSEDNRLIVEPRKFKHSQSFRLESGESLNGFELIYETYGELNKEKSNAILICHALSGNHHAAGVYSKDDKSLDGGMNLLDQKKPLTRTNTLLFL